MAKQTGGINDGFRGSVGTVIGYQWRGQWCMRAKPRFYHDAKSEAQLDHRALFKATVAYAGRVKEVLRVGFFQSALDAHKTACNYFLKVNKACFAMADGGLVVDYGSLRVSEGPVAPVAFGQPTMADRRMVSADFEKNPLHRRAEAGDKVYLAAFNAASGGAVLSVPAYRRMQRVELLLPEGWAGQEVHLYGFVQDGAGRTSESVYLGSPVCEAEEEPPVLFSFPSLEVAEAQLASTLQPLAQEAAQTAPQAAAPEASPQLSLLFDEGMPGVVP